MRNRLAKRFSSLGVKTKISIGFAVVLALHLTIAVMGHYGLRESDRKLARFEALHDETIAVAQFIEDVDALQRRVLLFTQTGHPAHEKSARRLYQSLAKRVTALRALPNQDANSQAQLEDIRGHLALHQDLFNAIVADRGKRKRYVRTELTTTIASITSFLENLSERQPTIGQQSISEATAAINKAQISVLEFINDPDSSQVRAYKRDLARGRSMLAALIDPSENSPVQTDLWQLIASLDQYETDFLQMVQATRGYLHLVNVVMAGETVEFQRLTDEYQHNKITEATALSNEMLLESRGFQQLNNAISALTILLGILAAGWVARQIAPPLNQVTENLERLAAGEHCDKIPGLERKDEVGKLAAAAQIFKEHTGRIEVLLDDANYANEQAEAARKEAIDYAMVIESTNKALEDANEAAVSATKAKSDFLANMSHEIRTPMTAILGYSEMLREADGNTLSKTQRDDAIDTVHRNGTYLLQLINDILDISKIEANKIDLEHIAFSPHAVVDDVVQLTQHKAEEKEIDLQYAWEYPIPKQVTGDPTRFKQILINLVGNAIKFTNEGQVNLTARWLEATQQLQIDVADSGVGMTAEQARSCFEAFRQADTSTTRKFGGTGLGLSISRQLAQLMGGDVSVQTTKVGAGTTMRVTVTLDVDEDTLRIESEDAYLSEPTTSKSSDKKIREAKQLDLNILLAEDGPDNQRLITFLLKKAGARVTLAENGQLAVDAVAKANADKKPFDVILMDMQMPVLDGYSATARLRDNGVDIPIIALTAHAMEGDRRKCLDAGCDDFATKPIDIETLIETIARNNNKPRQSLVTQ